MVELIPIIEDESYQEDIQLVQSKIDELIKKYIILVDRIRSIDKEGNRADRPIESRVHAFYRYIGFPVVGKGNFYNPGFPLPSQGSEDDTSRNNVNDAYDKNNEIKSKIEQRERDWEQRLSIFNRRDLASAVYCICQVAVRPFNLLNEETQSIKTDRDKIVQEIQKDNPKTDFSSLASSFGAVESVGANATGTRHILRPFSLDPNIVNNVNPDFNIIAVPFLKDAQELKITDGVSILRPGIELIIKERLRDRRSFSEAGSVLANVQNLLEGNTTPGVEVTSDIQDIKLALSALAEDNNLSKGTIVDLDEVTNIQVYVLTTLVKTIKKLTAVLSDSINVIQEAREEINWLPIVNALGPELDPRLSTTGATIYEGNIKRNKIDSRLADLEAKKALATARITQEEDLGNYASPFEINYSDTNIEELERQIQEVSEEKALLIENALLALRNIEIITGEISGIGLIDILAIYIALWAMDEQSLISLLDGPSFKRLEDNFPELLVGAAEQRSASDGKLVDDIDTALNNFEKTLKNVLDFAQKEFEGRSQVPGETEGGTISGEA